MADPKSPKPGAETVEMKTEGKVIVGGTQELRIMNAEEEAREERRRNQKSIKDGLDVTEVRKEVARLREKAIDEAYAKEGRVMLKMTAAEVQGSINRMEEELKKIEAEMWQFWAPVDAAIDALSGADQHDVFPTKKGGRVLSPTPDTAAAWLAKWALEPRGGLFKSKKAKLHDVLTAFVNNPSASAAVKSFLNRSEALESQKAKQ